MKWLPAAASLFVLLSAFFISCAKMGQPDGGWYDETPPRVTGASPDDRATNVDARKIIITFSEFIKLDNPTEKVVISPPQIETPEIKGAGKRIIVELKDTLKPHTTYTIDFSDAISDNNENNPLGNFTYSFSTGTEIDTMEVSGQVLEASNLEPIKGILVGLHPANADSAFTKEPFMRVARTDSRGRFTIKGIAPGNYRAYALKDADANYIFNQKSEQIAFNQEVIVPSSKPDVRPDTVWRDSLHIDSIRQIHYTHFLPDDIVLLAFNETLTDRFFQKFERNTPELFHLYFSYGSDSLPTLRGLNFNADSAFVVESNLKRDTIAYWLRDSALINQDTLRIEMKYMRTDSTGMLTQQTDTMEVLAKTSYEERLKKAKKEMEEWQKKAEKAEKKGQKVQPPKSQEGVLKIDVKGTGSIDPDQNIIISVPTPLQSLNKEAIHLYSKKDTLWYKSPLLVREKPNTPRTYEVLGEWRPNVEYSLEIDSAAFIDIYGRASDAQKEGLKVNSLDQYSTLLFTVTGADTQHLRVQLIDQNGGIVKETRIRDGVAEFFYVKPGTYFMSAFADDNENGLWDTGLFEAKRQPERVYYYPRKIECKEKWDITETWNLMGRPLTEQKPQELIKQKAEQAKTIKRQNFQRAKKLGIPLPEDLERADKLRQQLR